VAQKLKSWDNTKLIEEALHEIVLVHKSYARFSSKSPEEAREFLRKEFPETLIR